MYSMLMFDRDIYQDILQYLGTDEAIIITGPRRVGKTTALNYFFDKIESSNKIFLDLEDPLTRSYFDKINYEEIKQPFEQKGINFNIKNYIFLDEIQFHKNLPSIMKYFHDHFNTKFFVTGSSSFYLKNLFSESMSGRKHLFEMYPLSFAEFLRFKETKYHAPNNIQKISESMYIELQPLFEEYILYGGYPKVVLAKTIEEKTANLRDIFTAYFQKEILELSDFRKDEEIRKLILLLTERVGQKLDIQKISSEMGISRVTIANFLEFLHGTYLIDLISPFGKNGISIRKQSKVYFIDTGLLNFLGKKEIGNIFENSVYLTLKKKEDIVRKIKYYENEGKEIDFIIDDTAYEVKSFPSAFDLSILKRRSGKLNLKLSFIVSYKYSKLPDTKYGFQIL